MPQNVTIITLIASVKELKRNNWNKSRWWEMGKIVASDAKRRTEAVIQLLKGWEVEAVLSRKKLAKKCRDKMVRNSCNLETDLRLGLVPGKVTKNTPSYYHCYYELCFISSCFALLHGITQKKKKKSCP